MAFSSIDSNDIQPGKPSKKSLWQKVKDNFDWLYGKTTTSGLANGSFEIDADSDTVPDNWTRSLYPGGSGGFETTSPEHGSQSYKFTHPGGAGNGGGYLDSDYIEVSELEPSALKFTMRSSVTGIKNIVQVRYYDKDKVFQSSIDLYNGTAGSTSAAKYSYTFTPPANARFVTFRLIGGYTDTDVAGSTYFDGVALDFITDGSITNAKINGGHLSFNMVETSFTWTAYQDIGKGWQVFIPKGVTKISVQFRAKNSVNGANVRARLRIGSTYGGEGYITSDTNYEILNLDITPASGDKNTYVQMVVQTYVSSGTGYMHHSTASSDNSGNVDYSSAATFVDI